MNIAKSRLGAFSRASVHRNSQPEASSSSHCLSLNMNVCMKPGSREGMSFTHLILSYSPQPFEVKRMRVEARTPLQYAQSDNIHHLLYFVPEKLYAIHGTMQLMIRKPLSNYVSTAKNC